jgi:hypothetical protein
MTGVERIQLRRLRKRENQLIRALMSIWEERDDVLAAVNASATREIKTLKSLADRPAELRLIIKNAQDHLKRVEAMLDTEANGAAAPRPVKEASR